MISVEQLLAPVTADSPTGADASSSGLLLELESLIQGRPETQFAAAEEPNWHSVAARCLEAAAGTRDLRVGAILTAVLLRTDGLSGLHQGLQLLRGYLAEYWESVHPRLDPADDNDPQERINVFNNLAAPPGTDGDLFRIIEVLRRTPLVESPQTGRYGLGAWLAVKNLSVWPESAGALPSLAMMEGTRRDTNAEKLGTDATAAAGCIAELSAIAELFGRFAGPANIPAFEPLRKDLQQIVAWIGIAPPSKEVAGNGSGRIGGEQPARTATAGEIHSRADVLKALDAIIEYYNESEPSSPVPFLLQRVKRIVPLNFMELIHELSPESIEKLLLLTGPLEGESTPETVRAT